MVSIDQLLIEAGEMKASDLHLSVGVPPKVRIRGGLAALPYDKLLPNDTMQLATELFANYEAKKNTFLKTGEADFAYEIVNHGRYRVNIFRQKGNVSIVCRLINTRIPTPAELGLPDAMVKLTEKKRGMVLVTGPTGSGKSTTLASLINIINTKKDAHIITLEDPIEYVHQHKKSIVNQREIGLDTVSYAASLRAALREDPDVILVGEMRDLETISTAVTAAETGHLVFSTLHTIGAAPTVDRIIDVFPPHQQQQIRVQLATLLEAIISQQLLPTADGMERVAAFEIMLGTSAARNLIREAKPHQLPTVIQTSRQLGMITMDDYLYDLYRERRITKDACLSFSQDRKAMEEKM